MKCFIYETESVAFEAGCVEVVVVIAEDRSAADSIMLKDRGNWLSDQKHLESVYKVEERSLEDGIMLRAKMYERIDEHKYSY